MSNYTFSTLNDRDFEHLTQDLLQKELNLTFERFKDGKDQGTDLRYARNNQNVIVQCKDYYKSGFNSLLSNLKGEKGEFAKAKKLNTTRYILVTSAELSPDNKDKIYKESNGLIKNLSDIIGNEDLNNFIGKFPEIEKKHYKLWLSSINILEKIFHNQVNNSIIESSTNKILEIQKIFLKLIRTEQYSEAYKKLSDNNIIFITGEAGCGKSTISEMLFIDFIGQGYQGWFSDDLSEFKSIVNTREDKNSKEIFFWDDIFGHTYFQLEKGFDTGIVQFIQSIKNSKNKYLIINSRTSILNQAFIKSPKKLQSEETFRDKYELQISNYSEKEKAEILRNHALSLDQKHWNILTEGINDESNNDYFIKKIVNHKNYSPRLIQFVTDKKRFKNLDSANFNYKEWIIKQLENPEEVWSDYFDNLSPWAKDYLKISYTFVVKKQKLIDECFTKILSKKSYNNETDLIKKSIDELTNSFLNLFQNNGENYYRFFNPSIEDFLTGYFNVNLHELQQILENAVYLEQFEIFDNSYLPFYKQNDPKLEPPEDLKKLSYEYIKDNENNLKTITKSKDLSLYKLISKLPSEDHYKLQIINKLIDNIDKVDSLTLFSILIDISDEESNFHLNFDEKKIGILAYN